MFQLKNITKTYNENNVLNQVSVSIETGMNFIVGASGSGKSTLLKIISGLDKEYEGEVYLCDRNIKDFNSREMSYLYNTFFGFIWQDFQLLDDSTVLENILLPTYLKSESNLVQAKQILRDLKLKDLENKQVKYLSGGQKQRVAIARELMKNPKVILADEPTSALDQETSQEIMQILRNLSKKRPVIMVTHDTSFINEKDTVFELDKGELIHQINALPTSKRYKFNIGKTTPFSFHKVMSVIRLNTNHHKGRFAIFVLCFIMATSFLSMSFNNNIGKDAEKAFNEVFDMYGESVLDIGVYNSFTGAAGTSEKDNDSPNVDVDQNIKGLYEKYNNDKRVEFITYLQAFDDIEIQNAKDKISIQSSGNMPVINKLIAGRMANGTEKEVVIPDSLLKKMGVTAEEILNKDITFNGSVTDSKSSVPKTIKIKIQVKVVGVMDASLVTNFEGKKYEYDIEDTFLFSKSALSDMFNQTSIDVNKLNFLMRAKTPSDMISIKNELNEKGIVPLGNFEVIEDIVKLNSQSSEQTSSANIIIVSLVFIMVISIFLITSILRKKEYAVFKISGFHTHHLRKVNFFETLIQSLIALLTMIVLSPIINLLSNNIFHINIISLSSIGTIILLLLGVAVVGFIVTEVIYDTTHVLKALKKGER